jgi:hypothetical protein
MAAIAAPLTWHEWTLGVLLFGGAACLSLAGGLAIVAGTWRARDAVAHVVDRCGLLMMLFAFGMVPLAIGCLELNHAHRRLLRSQGESLVARIEAFHRNQGAYPSSLALLAAEDGQSVPECIPDYGYWTKDGEFGLEIPYPGFMELSHYDSRSGAWVED